MALSTIDRLLAQLHGVIGEARLVPVDDPRWGVYWAEAHRLSDMVDNVVPGQSPPVTTDNGGDETRRGAPAGSLSHHHQTRTYR
jgi:hypothetical protein